MKDLGSCAVINSLSSDFREQLRSVKETYHPLIAFECIGGDMTGTILNSIEENGTLYHYGNLSLRNCSNISTHDLIFMSKKIEGFWLFKYLKELKDQKIFDDFNNLVNGLPDILFTKIQTTVKPEDFETAFKIYRNDMSQGKVLFDFT